MQHLIKDLKENIKGEVYFDKTSRQIYSVDASIYEIEPIGIIVAKNKQDIIKAVQIAASHQVPIIPRGAGTGLTGGCIGKALIIDTSKYVNKILSIDEKNEFALCEAGVVQNQLNSALANIGYRLGPDTSTGNRATLGGMLGNNAAGSNSLRYGKMVDHVEEVEVVLANGETIHFSEIDACTLERKCQEKTTEGHIYRKICHILKHYHKEIELKFPKIPRRVSGYNLDELIKKNPLNLSKLIVGAEGTLGIATEMKVKISKTPPITALCVLHFRDLIKALESVTSLLEFQPFALELIDKDIIEMGRSSPSMQGRLSWLSENPQALLVIQFDAQEKREIEHKLSQFEYWAQKNSTSYLRSYLKEKSEMANVWSLRKSGLGLLMSRRTYSRAIAFIEDLTVPPKNIAPFVNKLQKYLQEKGKTAGMYGHAGAGLIHIRPYIDLRKEEEVETMVSIMKDTADLVLEHGGALTGEHGDGLIRSWCNEKMFGEKIFQSFLEIKTAFDPENRMNPGKIVNAPPVRENLRMNPKIEQTQISTFQDFSKEGGFELSIDMCNGNGQCRKRTTLMCPSYQAQGDERLSTRARAQSLRAITNGRIPQKSFSQQGLYDILDLCLECKGCKKECPSQIDMAKIKSEFLYHYQEKHGYSLRSRLFANIDSLNRIGTAFAPLSNWFINTKASQILLNALGISSNRPLPLFTLERFSQWLKKQTRKKNQEKKVVLFNDTYTEYNTPEIGKAAFIILEKLGYEVIVPPKSCCGRPMISKGMLKQAQKKALHLVETLYPYAKKNIPILGLEPSCILTIKDDLYSILPQEKLSIISKVCITIDEFLANHLNDEKRLPLSFIPQKKNVMLHGHCYQKALVGTAPTLEVLRSIPDFQVTEIDSGCCGLAGSFGYEKEHHDFSLQVGEDRLFPSIRKSCNNTLFVANGISCRCQILHGTEKKAKHLVEILFEALS